MAILNEIITTLVMVVISSLALLFAARKLKCEILIGDAAVVAGTVEIIIMLVRNLILIKTELITLVISILVGIYMIEKMYREHIRKATAIFFLWFVIRLIASVIVGAIAGVITAL